MIVFMGLSIPPQITSYQPYPIMKLYQLLQAYDFDELMPVINDMFPGTSKFRPELKHAYDLLLSMQPVASKKAIRYKILPGDTANHSYVGAEDTCFNATWEVCLGKDVSRERGVDLSDIELVANSLVNLCLQAKYPKVFEKDHQTLLKG